MKNLTLILLFIFLPQIVYSQQVRKKIFIKPDTMGIAGDVTIAQDRSIILGVDSIYSESKNGATASTSLDFDNFDDGNYYAFMTIKWDGNYGIVSENENSIIEITVDDLPIVSFRSNQQDVDNKDIYLIVDQSPVITSFKIQNNKYKLNIFVPEECSFKISSIEIEVVKLDNNIHGFCFSPFRNGQDPNSKIYPNQEQIREDIEKYLQHKCNSIRTYSCTDSLYYIVPIADEYNLDVSLGAWLDNYPGFTKVENDSIRQREIDSLVSLANNYDNISSVVVGNEVLLNNKLPVDTLIRYIRQVKSRIKNNNILVSYADVYGIWLDNPKLVDSVDYITAHFYPYWESVDFENALDFVKYNYNRLKNKYPGKKIVIGEIGMPSDGQEMGSAVPSVENQRRFITEFLDWTKENDIDYYYFEAFDEVWKRKYGEGEAGAHWGILDTGRVGKHQVQTLLFPPNINIPDSNNVEILNVADNINTNIRKLPLIIEFEGNFQDTASRYELEFEYENLVVINQFGKRERIYCDAILKPGQNTLRVNCSYGQDDTSISRNIYYDPYYSMVNKDLVYQTAGNSVLVAGIKNKTALGRIILPFDDGNKLRTLYKINDSYLIVAGSGGICIINTITNKVFDSLRINTTIFAAVDRENYMLYFITMDDQKKLTGVELDLTDLKNLRTFALDSLRLTSYDVNNIRIRFAVNRTTLLIGWGSTVAAFDKKTLKYIKEYDCGIDGYLEDIEFHPTEKIFIATNASWGSGDFYLVNMENDSRNNWSMGCNFAREIEFSYDGDTLFSVGSGGFIGLGGCVESYINYYEEHDNIWKNTGLFTGSFDLAKNNLYCAVADRHNFEDDSIKFALGVCVLSSCDGSKLTEFPIGFNDVLLSKYGFKEIDISDLVFMSNNPDDVFYPAKRKLSEKSDVLIYPNPATDNIKIEIDFKKPTSFSVYIYNMLGNIKYSSGENFGSSYEENLDLSSFSAGFYNIIINSGSHKISQFFIKI